MKKQFLKTLLLSVLILLSISMLAQKEIAGVVKDDTGVELPGVTVSVKGTTVGTITDLNGAYTISVPSERTVLLFSFVGMAPKEITVGNQTVINVVLEPTDQDIEEVVVTALGISREEKSLGYSVENVKAEELTRVAQENVLNSMAGKVSGVTINSTGGTGSTVSMVIRGATSLSTDNQPLFVVDGVPKPVR